MAAPFESFALTEDRCQQELAKRHLKHFVQYMWDVLEPTTELHWGWALDAVCDHLEAVTDGLIKRLVINVPPRTLKSTIASVMWQAWEWLRDPSIRYLTASYDMKLAGRDALKTRRLIQSEKYQALISDEEGVPAWKLSGDQNVKTRYENDKTGHRIIASPSAGGLGEGGSRVTVDDAHNTRKALSEENRLMTIDWWDQTMFTRRNDLQKDARVVIGQRLHQEDLPGNCIKQGYDLLCLPLEFDANHPYPSNTALNFVDPRTKQGEILLPSRFPPEVVAELKLTLGPYGYPAQMLQRPAPPEGGILKTAWFSEYTIAPSIFEMDKVITSWDLSFKGEDKTKRAELRAVTKRSYVVGQVWGFKDADSWLFDQARGQWDIRETIQQFLALLKRWPKATGHLVEDKANGPAVETLLHSVVPGILLVNPQGSKIQRAFAVAPHIAAGNVHLPTKEHSPWVVDFLDEVANFPFGSNDDQVDAMTQGLVHEQVDQKNRTLQLLQRAVGNV